jgi:succinate dehydrogenase / fumarate reductase cytochrome b subunit
MTELLNGVRASVRWFNPRGRSLDFWAFIANRLSGIGLTFYLVLHLVVLHKLAQGPGAYDDFVRLAQSPLIKAGEVVLIAAVVFHGLNGLRLILHTFGLGLRQRTGLVLIIVLATLLMGIWFALHIFRE